MSRVRMRGGEGGGVRACIVCTQHGVPTVTSSIKGMVVVVVAVVEEG